MVNADHEVGQRKIKYKKRKIMQKCKTNFVTDPTFNLPKKHGGAVGSVSKYWDDGVNDQVETYYEG